MLLLFLAVLALLAAVALDRRVMRRVEVDRRRRLLSRARSFELMDVQLRKAKARPKQYTLWDYLTEEL